MRLTHVILLLLCTPFWLLAAESSATAPSGPDAILAEIEALPRPDVDKSRADDKSYMDSYRKTMAATWKRQAELESMFYQRYPDHPQAESIVIRHWSNALTTHQENADEIQGEVDQFLKDHPNGLSSVDAKESFEKLRVRLAGDDPTKLLALAKDFAANEPHNENGADFYLSAAEAMQKGDGEKILRQIIQDYPNSAGAIHAGGILRRESQIGMPFHLGFYDVASGEWTHTRWLRGKVVVVDFWATWCPPCVGDIPHLQKVYAQYKGRGLEILGISLDGPQEQTNLETLKAFIAKHQISWPQYYQGEGFHSEFSSSWGIEAIPAIFVIDQTGNLYSTDAYPKKLDDILAKLLPTPK